MWEYRKIFEIFHRKKMQSKYTIRPVWCKDYQIDCINRVFTNCNYRQLEFKCNNFIYLTILF